MKLHLLNSNNKIKALYPKVHDGMDLDDHFWIDLRRRHLTLVFKVKKMASWVKVGVCDVDVGQFNSGEKEAHWHNIIDKQDVAIGRVMLAVQMQYCQSVVMPPECTLELATMYQEQLFASRSTLALVRHLEASHREARASREFVMPVAPAGAPAARRRATANPAGSGGGGGVAAAMVVAPQDPAMRRSASAAAIVSGASGRSARAGSGSAGAPRVRRSKSSQLDDAAAAAAEQEMQDLERALEESRRAYERECAERECVLFVRGLCVCSECVVRRRRRRRRRHRCRRLHRRCCWGAAVLVRVRASAREFAFGGGGGGDCLSNNNTALA